MLLNWNIKSMKILFYIRPTPRHQRRLALKSLNDIFSEVAFVSRKGEASAVKDQY